MSDSAGDKARAKHFTTLYGAQFSKFRGGSKYRYVTLAQTTTPSITTTTFSNIGTAVITITARNYHQPSLSPPTPLPQPAYHQLSPRSYTHYITEGLFKIITMVILAFLKSSPAYQSVFVSVFSVVTACYTVSVSPYNDWKQNTNEFTMAVSKPAIFVLAALANAMEDMAGDIGTGMIIVQFGMIGSNIMHQMTPIFNGAVGLVMSAPAKISAELKKMGIGEGLGMPGMALPQGGEAVQKVVGPLLEEAGSYLTKALAAGGKAYIGKVKAKAQAWAEVGPRDKSQQLIHNSSPPHRLSASL